MVGVTPKPTDAKSKSVHLYTEGAYVWVPDPIDEWIKARLLRDYSPSDCQLELLVGVEGHSLDDSEPSPLVLQVNSPADLPELCNPDILVGDNDLTALSYLHEPEVLFNLKVRFQRKTIYTYCGIILVAVNPYQELPLYTPDEIEIYRRAENVRELDPHIFAVGEEAISQMQQRNRNQSVIVSGESGAGKTVSAKYVMRYIATVSGAQRETDIERRILASNPVMEAFGNAKTVRNDNSSRFGKFIEMKFTEQAWLSGASIRTYLLEKSRVVYQAKDERNYHIFYQICAAVASGSSKYHELQDLDLGIAANFDYANHGRCTTVGSISDLDDFDQMLTALALLGFLPDDRDQLWRLLGAIMHLGNVRFEKSDSESCCIQGNEGVQSSIKNVCRLLKLEDEPSLKMWLVNRLISTAGEQIKKPLTKDKAVTCRDSIAKKLYAALFDWVVAKINRSVKTVKETRRFIGVLDIYGFETFEDNSFEQLCINFANEKLQQQFTQHVFKLEQDLYKQEKICWTYIDFTDNALCIELIEARLGIIDLLNEECKLPKGSDQNWLQKMTKQHENNKHFVRPRLHRDAFQINHFAGPVIYSVEGFMEKNNDHVNEQLLHVFQQSRLPLLREILADAGAVVNDGKSSRSAAGGAPKTAISGKTQGGQFKESLVLLMQVLNETTPHYVRCIKPNDAKAAFVFEAKRALQQLRACGVLETVRISAQGYPSRWTYPEFTKRYKLLLPSKAIDHHNDQATAKVICQKFLQNDENDANATMYQFGLTRIFFRIGQVASLEQRRALHINQAAIVIQRTARRFLGRRRRAHMLKAVQIMQQAFRAWIAYRRIQFLRMHRAVLCVQSYIRMYAARRKYVRMRYLASKFGQLWRSNVQRRKRERILYEQGAVVVQSMCRGYLVRRQFLAYRRKVVLVQCCVRKFLAKRQLLKLREEARSVERYKDLNKGLENKIIELQQKFDGLREELRAKNAEIAVGEKAKHNLSELKMVEARLQAEATVLKQQVVAAQHGLRDERNESEQLRAEIARLKEALAVSSHRESVQLQECEQLRLDLAEANARLADESQLREKLEQQRFQERRPSTVDNVAALPPSDGDGDAVAPSVALVLRQKKCIDKLESSRQDLSKSMEALKQRYLMLECKTSNVDDKYHLMQQVQELSVENERLKLEIAKLLESKQVDQATQKLIQTKDEEIQRRKDEHVHLRALVAETMDRRQQRHLHDGSDLDSDDAAYSPYNEQLYAAYQCMKQLTARLELQAELQEARYRDLVEQNESLASMLTERQDHLIKEHPNLEDALEQYTSDEVNRLSIENLNLRRTLERRNHRIKELQKHMYNGSVNGADLANGHSMTNGHTVNGQNGHDGNQLEPIELRRFGDMIECPKSKVPDLITRLCEQLTPRDARRLSHPCLPAYVVFMCMRHADAMENEEQLLGIFYRFLNSVKRLYETHTGDLDLLALWLANCVRLLQLLRQYNGDPEYQTETVPKLGRKQQSTKALTVLRYDVSSLRQALFESICNIYKPLCEIFNAMIRHQAAPAVLDHEGINGLNHRNGTTASKWKIFGGQKTAEHAMSSLTENMDHLFGVLTGFQLDWPVIEAMYCQIFHWISVTAMNTLLLRRDCCNLEKSYQIKFNVAALEEWAKNRGFSRRVEEELAPLREALNLLMCRKQMTDVHNLCGILRELKTAQVLKLLNMYRPVDPSELPVTQEFLRAVQETLSELRGEVGPVNESVLCTPLTHALDITFVPSQTDLATLDVSPSLGLMFVKKL